VCDARFGTPRLLLLRRVLLLLSMIVVMLRGRWRQHQSTPGGQHQRAAEAPDGQSATQ